MRSPLSGPIVTLLVFIPLVAVPLIAVFGMPQISALAPSSAGDDLQFAADKGAPDAGALRGDLLAPVEMSREPMRSADDRAAPPAAARRERRAADPFAEFDRAPETGAAPRQAARSVGNTSAQRPQRAAIDEGNGLVEKTLIEFGGADVPETGMTGSSGDRPVRAKSKAATRLTSQREPSDEELHAAAAPADDPPSSPPTTDWRKIVARLNAIGIRDFQLQPGLREGEFHFSCLFVVRDSPRVIRRFEAEAAEPLEAATKVLRQIDEWRARHRPLAGQRSRPGNPDRKVTATDPFEQR